MRLNPLAFLASLALATLVSLGSASAAGIGIVLLHGNGSNGSQFDDMRPIIEKAGYGLETPDMCWSDGHRYSRPAEECMDLVDQSIAKLKAAGYDRIVVAGHSMGGINAILYAAYHKGLAGLIAFAPSSPPKGDARNPNVALARESIKRGQGDMVQPFPGGINDIWTTPRAYLSYVGQESVLYDNELLPKITTPILWVAGTQDPGQVDGPQRFKYAPVNPLNAYVTVEADHFATPDVAVGDMIKWLDRLKAVPPAG